jgi:hypothetical protein
MLTVYLYNAPRPPGCFDLSYEPISSLVDAAIGIYTHHKTATLWFGYLEGWMLDAAEETKLRMVIRAFHCHVVTREPFSFSQAWKNEINVIHVNPSHGESNTHNDGRFVYGERPIEHEPSFRIPPLNRLDYQN